jgi:flavorubredoxin
MRARKIKENIYWMGSVDWDSRLFDSLIPLPDRTSYNAYPEAKLISTPKAKGMLIDLLKIPENFFITVADGETLSLGDKTLKFIYTPWVHWPETMVTYLEEDKILFSCDFFDSHIASAGPVK